MSRFLREDYNFRKIIALQFLFQMCGIFIILKGEWVVQNPLPTEASLLKIEPFSDKRLLIGGFGGTLLETTDAGETWKVKKLTGMDNIHSISFQDSLKGLILDSQNIKRTEDGGVTWKPVSVNVDLDTYVFLNIYTFDDVLYLIMRPITAAVWELVDAKSLVCKSIDGGRTWEYLNIDFPGKIHCSFFLNISCGFLYVEEHINIDKSIYVFYRTQDGGITWERSVFPDFSFTLALHFFDANTGFVGRYRTSNGGKTWKDVFGVELDSMEGEGIEAIAFSDSLHGWSIGNLNTDSKFFFTVDGGNTWHWDGQKAGYRQFDIEFCNNGTGWVVGSGGSIIRKHPKNNIWERVSRGPTNFLRDVFFIDTQEGWCVGDQGAILHTINGGEVWENQTSNTDSILFSAKFTDSENGWAVGYHTALRTQNGGQNWQVQTLLKGWFTDIDFFDENHGLLVERNGAVLRTADGGDNWQVTADTPLSTRLTTLAIVNENEAWIGGFGGLAYTNDKGQTFQWYPQNNLSLVKKVQFVSGQYGWLNNDKGDLWENRNNGKTWNIVKRGEGLQFGHIDAFCLLDEVNAWIYLEYLGTELIYSTNGQNLTGEIQYISPSILITDFFSPGQNIGWAVGAFGTILKYTGKINMDSLKSQNRYVSVYPNPFGSSGINISFHLHKAQFVKTDIYNILGHKIQEIYNCWILEGDKKLFWIPGDFAIGVYFIKVQCDEFCETIKCTFLDG